MSNPIRFVPRGGSAGQVLTKDSGDNYDASWSAAPGLLELADDPSPELGSALDAAGFDLLDVGSIGVGTASLDGTVHIQTGVAGTVAAPPGATDLVIENNGNAGLHILAPDADFSGVRFGSPSDSIGAIVDWNYDNDTLRILTAKSGAAIVFSMDNAVEAVRLDLSGVRINTTGTIGSSDMGRVGMRVKPSDTSRAATDTYAADTHLLQDARASKTYVVECNVIISFANASHGGIKLRIVAPAGATVANWCTSLAGVPTSASNAANSIIDEASELNASTGPDMPGRTTANAVAGSGLFFILPSDAVTAGHLYLCQIFARVDMSATAGDIELQWSQQTSNANATVVEAASTMKVYQAP